MPVLDDHIQTEFIPQADSRHDVICAVSMGAHRDLTLERPTDVFFFEVTVAVFFVQVILSVDEGLAGNGHSRHAGRRGFLSLAVDPFGIFAKGHFKPASGTTTISLAVLPAVLTMVVVPPMTLALHGDHDGGDAGIMRVTKADIAEIDAVQRPQLGRQGIGHLVGIITDDIVDLFIDAHMGVYVDKTRA